MSSTGGPAVQIRKAYLLLKSRKRELLSAKHYCIGDKNSTGSFPAVSRSRTESYSPGQLELLPIPLRAPAGGPAVLALIATAVAGHEGAAVRAGGSVGGEGRGGEVAPRLRSGQAARGRAGGGGNSRG